MVVISFAATVPNNRRKNLFA